MVLACGAFGQSVSVVLEEQGQQLLRAEQKDLAGEQNLFKQLTTFPLYGIERIFVLNNDSSTNSVIDMNDIFNQKNHINIKDLILIPINSSKLAQLIANSTHVLSF